MRKFALLIFIASLIAFSVACKKNNDDSNIPYVAVNLKVYPSDPSFNKLQVPGGWVYITGGSMGIVVYRISQDEFAAFDRHSTYKPEDLCRIEVDKTQITAVDSCSSSQWVITDGSVTKGPATRPLKKYTTYWDGYALKITN